MSDARDRRELSADRRALIASLLRERAGAQAPAPAIARGSETEPAPASASQRHMWLAHQLAPDSPTYNISYQLQLDGELDGEALRRALVAIRGRHAALRTTFAQVDGEIVQRVSAGADIALPVIDFSHLAPAQAEQAADAWIAAAGAEPFDLELGPVMRAALVRVAPRRHRLLASVHHVAIDAWSVACFVRELTELYRADRTGTAAVLPELPVQFADFARWQRSRATEDRTARCLAYWTRQLGGDIPPLDLPTDFARSTEPTGGGARISRRLPYAVLQRLQALASGERTTLFAVLAAGLATLLHRYTGKTDIVIGTPLANREMVEIESLIGCFSTTVALRHDLGGNPRACDVIAAAARTAIEAQDHELPFEQVVAAVRPQRVAGLNPLFQVMLVFQNAPAAPLEMPGLAMTVGEVHSGTAKFELDIAFAVSPDGLNVSIEYRRDLFRGETIDRLISHLETLFDAMARAPQRRIGELDLLTAAERRQIVDAWNRTEVAFESELCLHQLAERHAARAPDQAAIVFGGRTMSYGELNRRANRLAHYLRSVGVVCNQPVGIAVDRSFEMVIGLLAILKAGGAYLPLDPAYPRDRLSFMMSDARVAVVLTQAHMVDLVAAEARRVVVLDRDTPEIAACDDGDGAAAVSPGDLSYVIYTSGSTGRPKAVMVDHRGRVNNFADFNRRFDIGPGDRLLSVSSLSFDMSAYDVFGTLMAGGAIVLPDPEFERYPAHWADLMVRERVTVWHSVPALLGMLVDHLQDGSPPLVDLRLALIGGDWIPVSLPGRARQIAPRLRFISMGGATEVSMDSTIYHVDAVEQTWKSIPYGVPMANQRCYVLDPAGAPVPVGVPGELFLGGIGLAWGYLGHPDLTAQKFLPDRFSPVPGARMYRTGDLARYLPDGNLELIGRIDFQAKIRGYRIELGEVQAALEEHPGVDKALATVHEVDGRKVLVGYVSAPGGQVTAADLRARLGKRLPDYMVPTHIIFLDAFPLTPNGKIDRRSLPRPGAAAPAAHAPGARPSTPTEVCLARIWSEVLRVDQVAADDSFFALGGDSVMAIQVVTRARAAGLSISPRQIFRFQVLSELARAADEAARDGKAAAGVPAAAQPQPGSGANWYPLAPMQRTMLHEHRRGGPSGLYVIQEATLLPGPFDRSAVEQAWRQVIERHPALRTCFAWDGLDEPRQIVRDEAALELEVTSLAGLSLAEQEARLHEIIAAHRRRGFDVTSAPLLRVHALELGEAATLLLKFNHYMILDGWSNLIVSKDLLTAYAAAVAGTVPAWAPCRPFRDYVAWIHAQDWAAARAYWKAVLSGFSRPNRFAADPHGRETGIAKVSAAITGAVAERLRGVARKAGLTLATLVQGAWGIAVAAATGERDVVFGTTVAARPAELDGVESMVGLLINTLPLRVDVDPERTVEQLLAAVQRSRVESTTYEYLPLDQIVALAGVATGARLFESVVVFANYPVDASLVAFDSAQRDAHPFSALDLNVNQTEFTLRLDASEADAGLVLRVTHDRERLGDAAARRLLDHVVALLGSFSDLTAPVGSLPAAPVGGQT